MATTSDSMPTYDQRMDQADMPRGGAAVGRKSRYQGNVSNKPPARAKPAAASGPSEADQLNEAEVRDRIQRRNAAMLSPIPFNAVMQAKARPQGPAPTAASSAQATTQPAPPPAPAASEADRLNLAELARLKTRRSQEARAQSRYGEGG